jgi:hypothetical protein
MDCISKAPDSSMQIQTARISERESRKDNVGLATGKRGNHLWRREGSDMAGGEVADDGAAPNPERNQRKKESGQESYCEHQCASRDSSQGGAAQGRDGARETELERKRTGGEKNAKGYVV